MATESIQPNSSEIHVLQVNIKGCQMAAIQLEHYIKEHNVDIVLLQEPFVKKFHMTNVPRGYEYFPKNTCYHPQAAIICRQDLLSVELSYASFETSVTIQTLIQNEYFYFTSIYCKFGDKDPHLHITRTFNQLSKQQLKHTLCGMDSNAHNPLWFSKKLDTEGEVVEEILLEKQLCLLNNDPDSPTFLCTTGSSFIDLSVAGCIMANNVSEWYVSDDESFSDHAYIHINLSLVYEPMVRYNISKTNWVNFNKCLRERLSEENVQNDLNKLESSILVYDSSPVLASVSEIVHHNSLCDGIEAVITTICECYNLAMDACIPKFTARKKSSPWWNPLLTASRKTVSRARKQMQTQRKRGVDSVMLSDTISRYRSCRKDYKKMIKESKRLHFQSIITSSGNPWGIISEIFKYRRKDSIPLLKKSDGSFCKSNEDNLEFLLKMFFPDDDLLTEERVHRYIRNQTEVFLKNETDTPLPNILENEMKVATFSFECNKSPGIDRITPAIIQNTYECVKSLILKIFNILLRLRHFPSNWKRQLTIPIKKPKKLDLTYYKSFRPITLLPYFGKIYEKIIRSRLTYLSVNNSWISTKQFAYQKNKSGELAVSSMINDIEIALDQRKHSLVIFLDICGAFDHVWHPDVVWELIKRNCPIGYIKIIASYLRDRTVTLMANGHSKSKKLTRSSPQGSLLSDFIWNIIADTLLTLEIPSDTTIQAFADDSQIVITAKDFPDLIRTANQCMIILGEWSISHKMSFDPTKFHALLFTRTQKRHIPPFDIKYGNQNIKLENSVRMLGIDVDNKLSFNNHVQQQCFKAKKLLLQLNSYCSHTWGLSSSCLKLVYTAIIEPVILYGCFIWCTALKKQSVQKQLKSIQRKCAIMIVKGLKTMSYDSSIYLSRLPPIISKVEERIITTTIRYKDVLLRERINYGHVAYALGICHKYDISPESYEAPANVIEYPPPYSVPKTKFLTLERNEAITFANSDIEENTVAIFTDGSKIDDKTGNAFIAYCSKPLETTFREFKLQKGNSVFQNELFAIEAAVNWIISLHHVLKSTYAFIIFTDSLSSINDLSNYHRTRNSRTLSIIQNLIYSDINLTISWCPGHEGVHGNEAVDRLAKKAAVQDSAEIKVPLPVSHAKLAIRTKVTLEQENDYSISTCRLKRFFPTFMSLNDCLNSKSLSYQMVQILSGHCRLNSYLHTIGYSDSAFCSCGSREVETIEHFIFTCRNYEHLRPRMKLVASILFLDWPFDIEKVIENKHIFSAVETFVIKSKRLERS